MSGGALRVRARWRAGRIDALQVELERPPVARLLPGRTPHQVLAAVPLLHALCREAQGAAAAAALAAAAGQPAPEPRHQALWQEILHEHLWRLLLDWPPALGLEAPRDAFTRWRRQHQGAASDLCAAARTLFETGLGLDPEHGHLHPDGLAARCLAALGQAPEMPAPREASLPDPAAWLSASPDPASLRDEGTADDGTIATPPTPGLAYAQRLAGARLAWQALAAARPCPVRSAGRDGRGLGLAWTARGLLLHDVRLDADGRVADYRIQAPTDRLFATVAPLTRQLQAQPHAKAAEARRSLERAILALDPCVPWQIDWTEP